MAVTNYETEKLIAGPVQTQQVKFAADTYYRGMPLEYDADNDRYVTLTSGSIAGIFLGEETTLVNNDYDSIIIGGEIYAGGLVTDLNTAFTVTEDIIAAWAPRGFYIKRK